MNTKHLLSLLLIAGLTLVSCKKELQPQESSEALPADTTATAANTVTSPAAPTAMPGMQQHPGTVAVNPTPAPPPPVAVGKGMNPPHGQPGHRCDIAVGAPLNSPVAKPGVQPAMAPGKSVTINPSAPNANGTPVVTAPGMNPPHGQEGHRCDIAVGAPLSTPIKTAPTPTAAPALLAAPAETTQIKE
jgi:hypothetical protein